MSLPQNSIDCDNNVYYQMKADLSELLRGPTLKSEIYKTISGSKFGTIGSLLKNSVKKGVKYVEFASEGTEAASDIIKPTLPSNRSMKKLNSSANDSSLSNKKISKEASREKLANAQRPERRLKAVSGVEVRQKNRNYMLMNSQKPSKEKNKKSKGRRPETTFPSSSNKNQQQERKHKQKNTLSKSKSKLSCKMNLSSIIEQSSSEEQLITPQHKKSGQILQGSHNEEDKTTKKQRKEPISEEIRKKISKSFTDPEKFIKLIKHEAVTISYRVLKRKLIEIQIYTLKNVEYLSVNLEKGNLECQSIQETYHNLPPHTLLALFSSVRDVNILDPYNYPELHLEVNYGEKESPINRYLTLPYTFLNFSDEKQSTHAKKSRIKTKLCLEGLPINPKKMKILSSIFKTWFKKQFKGESEFETHFNVNDHEFRLRLIEEKETFTMQLEGRGEEKLTKVIDFFSKLIC